MTNRASIPIKAIATESTSFLEGLFFPKKQIKHEIRKAVLRMWGGFPAFYALRGSKPRAPDGEFGFLDPLDSAKYKRVAFQATLLYLVETRGLEPMTSRM